MLPHRARLRVHRAVLAVATLCAALAGCAGDDGDGGDDAAPVTATSAPATTSAPADLQVLEPLVLDDAPSGFALAPDDAGATGATDLGEAAGDTRDPGARDALAAAGFVQGWQRLWVSEDDEDELFLILYEFRDAAGADAFFERTAGGPAAEGGEGVFEVPAVPGAVGVTAVADGLSVTAVVATEGRYLVQVIGNGPEPGPSQGTVVALVAAQVERLP